MAHRLATIVVIDVDGFGALSRRDENAAIQAVARLNERAMVISQEYGGRVFNTAGDAIMMEFPNVAGGIEAAAALASDPDPPIRVGVHLGEVAPMPNGDLLGQGVNVATRLQAHAKAGTVLISEDAQRAMRGPLVERLVEKGQVKLDKIDQSITVFELSTKASRPERPNPFAHLFTGWRRIAIIGAAVVAAGIGIFFLWPAIKREPPVRVAVLAFTAPANDADLQSFASGVGDDAAQALNAAGIEVVSRGGGTDATRDARLSQARAAGAALALDGAIERTQGRVKVTINLASTGDRADLWSASFEGTPQEAAAVRLRAATQSAAAMNCGVDALRSPGSKLSGDPLRALLQACAAMTSSDGLMQAHDLLTPLVERDNTSAVIRAQLALVSASAARIAPAADQRRLQDEARAQADRARRKDPSLAESYLALELLETRSAWLSRESLLHQGLEHDGNSAALNARYADVLADVGRTSEALAYARRAVELDPLTPQRSYALAGVLLQNGLDDDAREITERLGAAWPRDTALWLTRLRVDFWGGRYDDALALLDTPASEVRSNGARQCWRTAATAMRATGPARLTGARAIRDCQRSEDLPANQTLQLYAALGDLDEAFAQARVRFVEEKRPGLDILFSPATKAMRADARFMPLMRDIGLIRYWHLSDKWPDFCRDPTLPYSCETEARQRR